IQTGMMFSNQIALEGALGGITELETSIVIPIGLSSARAPSVAQMDLATKLGVEPFALAICPSFGV
ncbi:MAG: hypothetical protein J6V14_07640, partial [Clostridia bacterium]|nr:hypothetical protein [Clostridia bacterium]